MNVEHEVQLLVQEINRLGEKSQFRFIIGVEVHWVPLTTSKRMQKKLLVVSVLVVTKLLTL